MKRQRRAAAVNATERVYELHGLEVPQSDEEDSDRDDDLDSSESDSSSNDSDCENVPPICHSNSPTGFIYSSEWKSAEGTLPNAHVFSADSGVKVDTSNFKHADYIKLFLTPDLINLLVEQTNLYAKQYIATCANLEKSKSRVHKWKDTTPEEMEKFIALLWLMGFIRKPTIESYWSRDRLLSTPIFSNLISRDRFTLLLNFFHFNDNSKLPSEKIQRRKYMIAPVVNLLNRRFQDVCVPTQDVCLDESLLKWLGNLSWKVFIPAKRARFGIKIYKLCCQEYTCCFELYFGKDDTDSYPNLNLSKTEKLVLRLCENYTNKWYHLYLDRLYSSPLLFDELYKRQIGACGTAKVNKKYMPKALKDKRMQKLSGEVMAVRNGPILAMKYSDRKPVYMLSTINDHEVIHTPSRRKGQGIVRAPKPLAIIHYNSSMGGVDQTDQMVNTYRSARKTMKWTKKVVLYLLQHTTLNAHHIYKKDAGKDTYMAFMMAALHEILSEPVLPHSRTPQMTDDDVRLRERHFIMRIPPNPSGKMHPSKNCRVCTLYTHEGTVKRKDTTFYCPDCPSKPPLCVGECFKIYHTKFSYK